MENTLKYSKPVALIRLYSAWPVMGAPGNRDERKKKNACLLVYGLNMMALTRIPQ